MTPAPRPDDSHPNERRPRLDLSITKVTAGAGAAAVAAAVGSKLGVAGTIVGAAVASVVSASAGAVLGHSLERGKTAALKARPALEAYQMERQQRQAPPGALDTTVILDGGTQGAVAPEAETVPLPTVEATAGAAAERRPWKDRLPGRKPLIALTVASFVLGTGAVTAYTLARDGGVPGQNGSVFSHDNGRSGSTDTPDKQSPGEGGAGDNGGSQHPTSPAPSGSGSSTSPSQTPTTAPTTPSSPDSSSGSSSGGSPTPPTSPSTGPTTPSTGPTTPATSGGSSAPSTPATQGATTPNAPGSATALGTSTSVLAG